MRRPSDQTNFALHAACNPLTAACIVEFLIPTSASKILDDTNTAGRGKSIHMYTYILLNKDDFKPQTNPNRQLKR